MPYLDKGAAVIRQVTANDQNQLYHYADANLDLVMQDSAPDGKQYMHILVDGQQEVPQADVKTLTS